MRLLLLVRFHVCSVRSGQFVSSLFSLIGRKRSIRLGRISGHRRRRFLGRILQLFVQVRCWRFEFEHLGLDEAFGRASEMDSKLRLFRLVRVCLLCGEILVATLMIDYWTECN